MGVDCRAYEQVTLVSACRRSALSDDAWDALYGRGDLYLSNMDAFVERGDHLPDGIYSTSGLVEKWRSSYSGYGRFRRSLCLAVLGEEPEVVWHNYPKYQDQPFAPLIHFADNEGFLGPRTCARLARDAETVGAVDLGEYQEAWPTWVRMFSLAADTGVITYS